MACLSFAKLNASSSQWIAQQSFSQKRGSSSRRRVSLLIRAGAYSDELVQTAVSFWFRSLFVCGDWPRDMIWKGVRVVVRHLDLIFHFTCMGVLSWSWWIFWTFVIVVFSAVFIGARICCCYRPWPRSWFLIFLEVYSFLRSSFYALCFAFPPSSVNSSRFRDGFYSLYFMFACPSIFSLER